MGLSSFLDVAVALSVLIVPITSLLAFFIWIAVEVQNEEEE
jgi:hypothetical protein